MAWGEASDPVWGSAKPNFINRTSPDRAEHCLEPVRLQIGGETLGGRPAHGRAYPDAIQRSLDERRGIAVGTELPDQIVGILPILERPRLDVELWAAQRGCRRCKRPVLRGWSCPPRGSRGGGAWFGNRRRRRTRGIRLGRGGRGPGGSLRDRCRRRGGGQRQCRGRGRGRRHAPRGWRRLWPRCGWWGRRLLRGMRDQVSRCDADDAHREDRGQRGEHPASHKGAAPSAAVIARAGPHTQVPSPGPFTCSMPR